MHYFLHTLKCREEGTSYTRRKIALKGSMFNGRVKVQGKFNEKRVKKGENVARERVGNRVWEVRINQREMDWNGMGIQSRKRSVKGRKERKG
jgi:hypothetical protein